MTTRPVGDSFPPLRIKYEQLLALRRADAAPRTCSNAQEREQLGQTLSLAMRRLSTRYPGALRELDRVPTGELEARLGACAAPPLPLWARILATYHALWRAAQALKQGERASEMTSERAPLLAELTTRVLDPAPGEPGRLNEWILAHAGAAHGVRADQVRGLLDGRTRINAFAPPRVLARGMPGLCHDCDHRRTIRSAKGSTFHRCELHDHDPRRRKYPPLPVLRCAGFRLRPTTTSS